MRQVRTVFTQPYWSFILPLTSWLFLIPVFFRSPAVPEGELYPWFFSFIDLSHSKSVLLEYISAGVTISLLAYFFNDLLNQNSFVVKRSHLSSLVISFFGSLFVLFYGWHFGYLSLLFSVLSLMWLMRIQPDGKDDSALFNCGFLYFLSSFIDPYMFLGVPMLFLAIVIIRRISIREALVVLSGGLIILFVLICSFYLSHRILPNEAIAHIESIPFWHLKLSGVEYLQYVLLVLLSFVSAPALVKLNRTLNNKGKLKLNSLFLMIITFGVIAFVSLNGLNYGEVNWSLPVCLISFLITLNYTLQSNKWMKLTTFLLSGSFLVITFFNFYSLYLN